MSFRGKSRSLVLSTKTHQIPISRVPDRSRFPYSRPMALVQRQAVSSLSMPRHSGVASPPVDPLQCQRKRLLQRVHNCCRWQVLSLLPLSQTPKSVAKNKYNEEWRMQHSTTFIQRTGPKISSLHRELLIGAFRNTVGGMKYPFAGTKASHLLPP